MDVNVRNPRGGNRNYEKIRWTGLRNPEKLQEFKTKVLNGRWESNARVLRNVAREVLGETSGKPRTEREVWMWKDEIQLVLKEKKELKKRWEQTRLQVDRIEYQRKKKEAKRAVAVTRAEAASELYEELETVEGQKKIYRIPKYRNKATKDISHVKQMRDGSGAVLRDEERVRERWKEYFENLLNEEYPREQHQNGTPNQGLTVGVTRVEVESAFRKMKNSKATGPDEIPVKAWRALGGKGVDLLWDLMIKIEDQEHIPDERRESVLVPIYKKGDVQECQNYQGMKPLSHTMKIWERIVDKRVRGEVEVAEEQFGFMPGRGTTNAIFILRQMAEKYREKGRDLHMVFIDLEKAYDRVPREELWRCLREKMVPEKYVLLIKEMFRDVKTRVRSGAGTTEGFEVKVGLHQGSALSPFLFNIVFDVLTRGVRRGVPWSMMYADDVVLCGETSGEVERLLEEWRVALESGGMRISRTKTEYMRCTQHEQDREQRVEVRLDGEVIKSVDGFKYLGPTITVDGSEEREVTRRIQAGWKNWREVSGVLCDRRMPVKLNGKVYNTVVRPAMMYGMEATPIKKVNEKRMKVAEMKMLRWMSGVTIRDRIPYNKRNYKGGGAVKESTGGKIKMVWSRTEKRWGSCGEKDDGHGGAGT